MGTLLPLVLFSVIIIGVRGLEFMPTPPDARSSLIWYVANNSNNTLYWRNKLDEFLTPYIQALKRKGSDTDCRTGQLSEPGSNTRCVEHVTDWKPCTSSSKYNYNSTFGGPCIFLKLTKIDGWKPIYYSAGTLPTSAPDTIRNALHSLEEYSRPGDSERNIVWISCGGEDPADIENIGPITYFPHMGFQSKYILDDHLSPIVAVYFEKPAHGVIINVECQAWAKNINDGDQTRGKVHFQFLID